MKKFFEDETGDTIIISVIIMLAVLIAAVVLFKPYIIGVITWITSILI